MADLRVVLEMQRTGSVLEGLAPGGAGRYIVTSVESVTVRQQMLAKGEQREGGWGTIVGEMTIEDKLRNLPMVVGPAAFRHAYKDDSNDGTPAKRLRVTIEVIE
jgi:hypothetical protein